MRLEQPFPVEFRYISSKQLGISENEPIKMVWMKAKDPLPDSLDNNFHHCVSAYLSDHELLNTSLIPHGLARRGQDKRVPPVALTLMASLDHSIWFHAPYRADEWLLYVMKSPRTIDGRGFSYGRVYTLDGTCVLSVAQEGVVRFKERDAKL